MMKSKANRALLVGSVLVALSAITLLYPDDWVIPRAVSALFGPILAMRMGFYMAGFTTIILSVTNFVPVIFRTTPLTIACLVVGIVIWCVTGFLAGAWLYA
jgi:hypothetical protein